MFELSVDEWMAVRLSLKVAAVATIAALPLALAVALLLARGRFVGKSLLDSLVHLPLVLPPVVVGYLLLIGFGRRGPFGEWLESHLGLVFSFRWTGAALACAVMGFPLMVRAIRLSIEAIDPRLEKAAATLGASPLRAFATITLPLAQTVKEAGRINGDSRLARHFASLPHALALGRVARALTRLHPLLRGAADPAGICAASLTALLEDTGPGAAVEASVVPDPDMPGGSLVQLSLRFGRDVLEGASLGMDVPLD